MNMLGITSRPRRRAAAAWAALLLAGAGPGLGRGDAGETALSYNRDIRPILFDKCFSCHGPDSASRKAELRLDRRDAAIEHGALAPGDAEASELVRRIRSHDPAEVMPPPESKKPLTAAEQAVLEEWIRQGAAYEPHWSLIAPVRPTPPAAASGGWARNPVDHFIAARLEALGLAPAAEADRRTLARRASLDLTGLPPAPEDVAEYLADPGPDAYERYVDRLLASPRWGEHRARYWLDYARYADTHGLHFDNFREMWSYRDWLIGAFNRNLPFDQFTVESLAGDLLETPTLDQLVASGFHRCNITTNEGGIIDEEYAVLYARDRTETTAVVWMGLTAGCGVCHDHKFDEFSQREFYALAAFFNNTTQGVRDGNVQNTPPVVKVPLPADRPRAAAIAAELAALQPRLDALRAAAREDVAQWIADPATAPTPVEGPALWAPLDEGRPSVAVETDGARRTLTLREGTGWTSGKSGPWALQVRGAAAAEIDSAGDFAADQPYACALWVRLSDEGRGGTLVARLDEADDDRGWDFQLEDRRLVARLIHRRSAGDAIEVRSEGRLEPGKWVHVAVVYDGSRQAAGMRLYADGALLPTQIVADRLTDSPRTSVPLEIGRLSPSAPLEGAAIEDVKLFARALPPAEIAALSAPARLAALRRAPDGPQAAADREFLEQWRLAASSPEYLAATARRAALAEEQQQIEARGTIAHVMQERPDPPTAYVLHRGEYDQRRAAVSPDTPQALPPFPDDLPRNRLGLARWLLLPEHPLTARVAVNRAWYEVFGRGIVDTIGDLGVSGGFPDHPELLDWLAVEFRESGWDVKHLYKLLVCSATYRQSAAASAEKLEVDPDNRFLSRGPRFRMDAEMVRDYVLAASGLLARSIGGPSVKPYQPPGVWEAVAMPESNTRNYVEDEGESLYRRSLYTFWKRSAPPALLETFNAPNREHCLVMRERTNTPLQALAALNGVQFVEAARRLAQRALREADPRFEPRVQFMAERLLSRRLAEEELAIVADVQRRLQADFQRDPEGARQLLSTGDSPSDSALPPEELAAWTMVANQLMNLDETLNK